MNLPSMCIIPKFHRMDVGGGRLNVMGVLAQGPRKSYKIETSFTNEICSRICNELNKILWNLWISINPIDLSKIVLDFITLC